MRPGQPCREERHAPAAATAEVRAEEGEAEEATAEEAEGLVAVASSATKSRPRRVSVGWVYIRWSAVLCIRRSTPPRALFTSAGVLPTRQLHSLSLSLSLSQQARRRGGQGAPRNPGGYGGGGGGDGGGIGGGGEGGGGGGGGGCRAAAGNHKHIVFELH
jgi:uncharacterized membrane protein YgcG